MGKVPTEMELVLEKTQQGTSHEVSVSTEGVEELKRKVKMKGEKKEALLTLRKIVSYRFTLTVLSALKALVMRTDSIAAKPCQGDFSEFYLITGSNPDGRSYWIKSRFNDTCSYFTNKSKDIMKSQAVTCNAFGEAILRKAVGESDKYCDDIYGVYDLVVVSESSLELVWSVLVGMDKISSVVYWSSLSTINKTGMGYTCGLGKLAGYFDGVGRSGVLSGLHVMDLVKVDGVKEDDGQRLLKDGEFMLHVVTAVRDEAID
nr:hypothetical protein [Tanacetum cinerariifolium]GEV47105.1 hypothetical protein [Tanacetum cinerariifolium]